MSDENKTFDLDEFNSTSEETVTEADVKSATDGEKPPVGVYHFTVAEVKGRDIPAMSCAAVALKLVINYAIEIDNKPVSREEGMQFAGRHIFDDIFLPKSGEPDWSRKRRINVMRAFGLIAETGGNVHPRDWKKVAGRSIIGHYEDSKSKKDGKVYRNINPFRCLGGYEPADTSAEPEVDASDI